MLSTEDSISIQVANLLKNNSTKVLEILWSYMINWNYHNMICNSFFSQAQVQSPVPAG